MHRCKDICGRPKQLNLATKPEKYMFVLSSWH